MRYDSTPDSMLTVREVREEYGVPRSTLYRHVQKGRLHAQHRGASQRIYFRRRDIEELLKFKDELGSAASIEDELREFRHDSGGGQRLRPAPADFIDEARQERTPQGQPNIVTEQPFFIEDDKPLVGVIVKGGGRDMVRYVIAKEEPDGSQDRSGIEAALSLIGAWTDLDWEEAEAELDRIRHESKPTPPITDL